MVSLEGDVLSLRQDLAQQVREDGQGFEVYKGKRLEVQGPGLPFLVSDRPFELPSYVDLPGWGELLAKYMRTVQGLVRGSLEVNGWGAALDGHIPEWMLEKARAEEKQHLFIRPDWVITDQGVLTAEIETSPFGLALSCFLDQAYAKCGYTCVGDHEKTLALLQNSGVRHFVTSPHTERFSGQFDYLARELAQRGHPVSVSDVGALEHTEDPIYRCFYLFEGVSNPAVERVLRTMNLIPPTTPQLEEKAIMGLLFDPALESSLKPHFDDGSLEELRRVVPKTVVVSSASSPSVLDPSLSDWRDIPTLPRSQRKFVLKPSGFSPKSSWSKGVHFLCDLSRERCAQLLREVLADSSDLWVMQTFQPGAQFQQPYYDEGSHDMQTMQGRVRVTPYFDLTDGSLLTAKATLRSNTHRLHAATDSINTAVSV